MWPSRASHRGDHREDDDVGQRTGPDAASTLDEHRIGRRRRPDVSFVMTNQETSGSLTVPARRFVDGSLQGWVANTDALSLPSGTYRVRSKSPTTPRAPRVAARRSPYKLMTKRGLHFHTRTRVVAPKSDAELKGTKYLVATASSELGLNNVEFRITGDGRTFLERAAPSHRLGRRLEHQKHSQWVLHGVQHRRREHRARHNQHGRRRRRSRILPDVLHRQPRLFERWRLILTRTSTRYFA